MNIASRSVIEKWMKGILGMLEKLKGNFNVDNLRGILLMELDYNFLSKLLLGVILMQKLDAR